VRSLRVPCVAAAFLILFSGTAHAAAGELDPTWGGDGLVFTPFPDESSPPGGADVATAVLADGLRVLAAGTVLSDSLTADFGLARYRPGGALDRSFGGDGRVVTDFGFGDDRLSDALIQPDGRIVAAGIAEGAAGLHFALARYLPDGSPDTGFGAGGTLLTTFANGGTSGASALAIDAAGRLLAAGNAPVREGAGFAVARYRQNGSLDPTFGRRGKVAFGFGWGNDGASDLVVLPDGRILLVGFALVEDHFEWALARLTADGALDPTFGGEGRITMDLGADLVASSVVLQTGGMPVVGGSADEGMTLVRLLPNGAPDPSFGDGGFAVAPPEVFDGVLIRGGGLLALGLGDSVVALGNGFAEPDSYVALARFLEDGSLDASFGGDGGVAYATNRWDARGVAVRADGRILTAGFGYERLRGAGFAVARFLG
jgi:uncharacterized delta-60 repeat protein